MEDDLVAWGRVLRIETRGRVSGGLSTAVVGFVEQPDGALMVAAGSPEADWGRNLLARPGCRVTTAGATFAAVARELEGPEHATAVRELILKYGQPAESLGAGPAFELRRGE